MCNILQLGIYFFFSLYHISYLLEEHAVVLIFESKIKTMLNSSFKFSICVVKM